VQASRLIETRPPAACSEPPCFTVLSPEPFQPGPGRTHADVRHPGLVLRHADADSTAPSTVQKRTPWIGLVPVPSSSIARLSSGGCRLAA